jgi:hypothetical protein
MPAGESGGSALSDALVSAGMTAKYAQVNNSPIFMSKFLVGVGSDI